MPNHINHPHQNLGKDSSYNDFAAELPAIHLTIEMLENVIQYTKCVMYTDGQAAINPGGQSSQSIVPAILDSVEDLRRKNLISVGNRRPVSPRSSANSNAHNFGIRASEAGICHARETCAAQPVMLNFEGSDRMVPRMKLGHIRNSQIG